MESKVGEIEMEDLTPSKNMHTTGKMEENINNEVKLENQQSVVLQHLAVSRVISNEESMVTSTPLVSDDEDIIDGGCKKTHKVSTSLPYIFHLE